MQEWMVTRKHSRDKTLLKYIFFNKTVKDGVTQHMIDWKRIGVNPLFTLQGNVEMFKQATEQINTKENRKKIAFQLLWISLRSTPVFAFEQPWLIWIFFTSFMWLDKQSPVLKVRKQDTRLTDLILLKTCILNNLTSCWE